MGNFAVQHLRAVRAALLVLGVSLLAACASNLGKFPAAPVADPTRDYTYIVGPGDNINIIVWRNPEVSMSVPVRPDGKFSTPLIDELVASGKTSVEIAREIEKQLEKYIRDPVVTVIVTGFVGPVRPADPRGGRGGEAAGPSVQVADDRARRHGRRRRADRLRGWQRSPHIPLQRGRQAVFRSTQGPDQAGRHLGQRRDEARRHPDHSAELLLSARTA